MPATATTTARSAFLVLVVTLSLNSLFLALALTLAALSPAGPAEAIRHAFAAGELVEDDYLTGDWRRGDHQYSDCSVLQLIVNPASSSVQKALAPSLYVSDGSYSDMCRTLRRLVEGKAATSQLFGDSYARYWQGRVPVAAALLSVTDLGTARQGLRLFVVGSLLALIGAAATAGGAIRIAGISVGLTGLLFWALPYYGQGLSHAPGDAVVMCGIAALIAWRRALQDLSRLVVFSASYGSLVTYLDVLTGQIPTAACLLFLFAYLARRDRCSAPAESDRSPWRRAIGAVAAFALGSFVTTAAKQLLVVTLIGPEPFGSFASNLRLYTGLSAGDAALPGTYLRAFFSLVRHTPVLTYYSIPLAVALLLASSLTWAAAALIAFRSNTWPRRQNFLAHLVGASGIGAWVLLLPTHTEMHGFFMVRMVVVPLALGWSALAFQLLSSERRSGPDEAEQTGGVTDSPRTRSGSAGTDPA